jgi:hypothetical protein
MWAIESIDGGHTDAGLGTLLGTVARCCPTLRPFTLVLCHGARLPTCAGPQQKPERRNGT